MSLMSVPEEDSYSTVFASLRHPIRRKILRILSKEPESFSGLQRQFRIESSHLTYHLEGLGSLLLKTENGKYALSSLGEAAVLMMKKVEEPLGASHALFLSAHRAHVLKPLVFLLICGLVASLAFNGVLLFEYTEANNARNGLINSYATLDKAYSGLDQAYSDLNKTYNELGNAYDYLNKTYLSVLGDLTGTKVYDLSSGSNFTTIQEAIDAAESGSTILVTSGVYRESLVLNKTLRLLGADKYGTVIEGQGQASGVTVAADGIVINGFTVRNWSSGIWLNHSNGTVVSECVITLNTFGVRLDHSFDSTVSNNIFSLNAFVLPGLVAGGGIDVFSSGNNTINGNVITKSVFGISLEGTYVEGSNNNTICGNLIENNDFGIDFMESYNNTISVNSFIDNGVFAGGGLVSYGNGTNAWSFDGRGNFWNDYVGLDDGSDGRMVGDGVGDTNVPWYGVDYYPLINPVSPIQVCWNNEVFPVLIMTNSTVSSFAFDQANLKVAFNLVGPANTTGYFDLSTPKALLSDPWRVLLDGTDVTSKAAITENQTYAAIYLNYSHSGHGVQIIGTHVIPEYPSVTTPVFLTLSASLLTVLVAKKRRKSKQY